MDDILIFTKTIKKCYSVVSCQVQFVLEGKSPCSWLGYAQSIETPCNKLGNVNLLERSWPQLMCCASYKPHGCNFRG